MTKYVWQKINDSINQTVDEMNVKALVEVGETLKESGTHPDVPEIEIAENSKRRRTMSS